jgi:hypothetical protein
LFTVGEESLVSRSPQPTVNNFAAPRLANGEQLYYPTRNPAEPAERITLPLRRNEWGETFAAGIRSERETNSQMPPLRRLDYKAFAALGSAGSTTP